MRFIIIFAMVLLMGAGCGATRSEAVPIADAPHSRPLPQGERDIMKEERQDEGVRTDFSQFNPVFRFSAEIPGAWKIEYVPEIEAINIYDPAIPAENVREQAQIFIRHFEANDFLTLRTVDILKREKLEVHGHSAVRYEIKKKAGVADFPYQPLWRNALHKLTDVRLTRGNPSAFYVFAYNPASPPQEFENFLQNARFHNDPASFVSPLDRPAQRISKKPFGLRVAPDNSPVQPEKFSGYHTAVDFEVFDEEENTPVNIRAFCGGPIREKRVADGYGGVMVQECLIGDEVVTVVYGHLKIDSVQSKVGEYITPGEKLGVLGAPHSAETAGERKHLHFGIRKGPELDLRGYVARESDLKAWINPMDYLK